MPIEIAVTKSFEKAYKKRIAKNKKLSQLFQRKLIQFEEDPYLATLETHKLIGKFDETWSFTIDYDCRVLFEFHDNGQKALLIDIGNHKQVY